jgi:heme/copper-type cytochrome/quinol oxidase subunit 2
MRRIIENRVIRSLLLMLIVFLVTSVASACPNCKEAMEKQDPTHGGLVKGYFFSIIFMMATPYLVLGSFCAVMYYRVRRARLAGKPKPPLAGAAASPIREPPRTAAPRVGQLESTAEPLEV